MGPTILFDKSFIQSLSIDESVWFDYFFKTNICPIFYDETLRNLETEPYPEKSIEETISINLSKTPFLQIEASKHHNDLCVSNLLGFSVPMKGYTIPEEGKFILYDGMPFPIFEYSPTLESLERFRNKKYTFVEREYAKLIDFRIKKVNLDEFPEILENWDGFTTKCKDFEDAKVRATSFIESYQKPYLRIEILEQLIDIPDIDKKRIRERWVKLGSPTLTEFAPYAAFQLSIIIFFFLCLRDSLISTERKSNLKDIVYLFYLPFCMIFISDDVVQSRIANVFLRNDQNIVKGSEMKASLKEINSYYSAFSDEQKKLGIFRIAEYPPKSLVSDLWDKHLSLGHFCIDEIHNFQSYYPYFEKGSWIIFPKK